MFKMTKPPTIPPIAISIKRSRRGTGAITLRDVAKLAGVAPITASRAINTPNQVSADVKLRIDDAVKRTGYVPNRIAGGLASSRSRLFAAVVPSTVMSVFMETIESLNDTLFEAGYQLMLGQTDYSTKREEQLLEAIISRRPDGIFITGILQSTSSRAKILASGIPVVESWDLTTNPIDMLVGFSHIEIGREVAKFFVNKHRKHFAVVSADDERAKRRADSFKATTLDLGCSAVYAVNVGASRSLKSGREALQRILRDAPKTDAIFCSSDLLALGVLTEARQQNIAIPKHLSVLGFGNVPFVQDMIPALSTVRINGSEIGRLSALALISRAENREVAEPIVDVGFAIIEREST
jgi:LacI family transcriptional regulator, gluconate utilization system Gnt-I transcriptional repressor